MPETREETLLVVDDTPANRYAEKRILEDAGFRVLEAGTGTEGLRLIREHRPALVVLDVKLPDMSGFEVVRRLRGDPETAAIQILHVSATYMRPEDRASGLEAGADGYLTSPIEPVVLVATVRALLRASRAERERLQLVRALEKSEARARRLAESGLVGVFYWDSRGRVTWANEAFLELIGRSREQLERGEIEWRKFVAPEWRDTSQRVLEDVLRNGQVPLFELQVEREGGERIDVLAGSALFEAGGGEGVAMLMDVSSRKRADRERARLVRELQEALRSRDEFLAMASHDLKSPLQTLLLKVGQLRKLPIADEALSRHLASLQEMVDRQVALVHELLDLSRLTAGRITLRADDVDLAALAREVVDRYREQSHQANCDVRVRADGSVVGRWDRLRLEQVIANLISNALKYGAGQPVEVAVEARGAIGRLVVRDRGIGIAEEDQRRIFERFERVTVAKEQGSFGLGLWIVQRIVAALGGTIRVASAPGEGAEFTVDLPRVGPPLAANEPEGERDDRTDDRPQHR